MKILISNKSETPIYEQLYSQIVTNIICGELLPDECLPSIRFVARELEISVIPVKAAYELLEKDGYIYTLPGKGCFVARVETDIKKNKLAQEKIRECVAYCLKLGLSSSEFLALAKECCEDEDRK